MPQAPGTQDVEKRIIKLKEEVFGLEAQLIPTRKLGSDDNVRELVEKCRDKYREMSVLETERHRETYDWITEKTDALRVS